uniref:Uncharacterized protein n=1 Tax=Mus spicilegus TaxID=10103 RepID=A0A8C6I8X2_MUSSI
MKITTDFFKFLEEAFFHNLGVGSGTKVLMTSPLQNCLIRFNISNWMYIFVHYFIKLKIYYNLRTFILLFLISLLF